MLPPPEPPLRSISVFGEVLAVVCECGGELSRRSVRGSTDFFGGSLPALPGRRESLSIRTSPAPLGSAVVRPIGGGLDELEKLILKLRRTDLPPDREEGFLLLGLR